MQKDFGLLTNKIFESAPVRLQIKLSLTWRQPVGIGWSVSMRFHCLWRSKFKYLHLFD
jgi:hypothetical protein